MRRTLASLLALLCGCGSGVTGTIGSHVSIRAVEVRVAGPATVRAVLGSPDLLPALIRSLKGGSVRLLSTSAEVCEETAAASEEVDYCVHLLHSNSSADSIALTYEVEGLRWAPEYDWNQAGGEYRISGSVRLTNNTGRSWNADTVLILDSDDTVLARAEDAAIPPGEVAYPWWSTTGRVQGPIVSFGWPFADRARALMAIFPRRPGPVMSAGGLPAYGRDTLWLPADSILEVEQLMGQLPDGYRYLLRLTNKTATAVTARLRLPRSLPRGASLCSDPPERIDLRPNATDSIALEYRYGR